MTKEYLEAYSRIIDNIPFLEIDEKSDYTLEDLSEDTNLIREALERLESIDNANPSETLEVLYNCAKLDRDRIEKGGVVTYAEEIEHNEGIKPFYDTIKQALLKAQEQEKENAEYKKVLEIIKKKYVDIKWLKAKHSVEEYNRWTYSDELTQEEFDLLKRWVENGNL